MIDNTQARPVRRRPSIHQTATVLCLALVVAACGKKEEATTTATAPVAEQAAPAVTAETAVSTKVAGMSVDAASGLISWQPAAVGDYAVTVVVRDTTQLAASQTFMVRVGDRNQAPVINNALPASIPTGRAFSHQVSATDPDGDALVYSLGSQAAGMTINANGAIYWANPQPGRYPYTLVVTDNKGARTTQQGVLLVDGPPQFVSQPIVSATVGQAYIYTAKAEDPNGDAITYRLAQGPTGMSLDPASGVVRWTPTAAGTHTIDLMAEVLTPTEN